MTPPTTTNTILMYLMIALACWTIVWNQQHEHLTRALRTTKQEIILPRTTRLLATPLARPSEKLSQENHGRPDYGGILYQPVVSVREINMTNDELYHQPSQNDDDDDTSHWYESFDDLDQSDRPCRHLPWSYVSHPTCNVIHEQIALDRPQSTIQFLDAGGFRNAWLFAQSSSRNSRVDAFVLKSLVYERNVVRSTLRNIQKEAMLFDRLKPTGLVSNLYAHCGTSVMVEKGTEVYDTMVPPGDHERISLEDLAALQTNKTHPMNDLTDSERLELALAMAKSLDAMHKLGIVHSDVTIYQWLRSDIDNRIMLNDVNSAEYMQWNAKRSEHCKYWARYDWGRFKAPEEYAGGYLDTSVDVWSMGNLIYGILTGLQPYHYIKKTKHVHKESQNGPPQIDSRYSTEGTKVQSGLYKIMKNYCHRMIPSNRASMAQVVAALEQLRG